MGKANPGTKEKAALSETERTAGYVPEHHAISKEQYDKSLRDMTEKMGYGESYDDKS
jgi:hypothetical protein